MNLFRIASLAYPIFDGTGAALCGGRWNNLNQKVIYCAQTPAISALENLVHIDRTSLPTNHGIIEIYVPDEITIEKIERLNLPLGWDSILDFEITRKIGSDWYQS